MGKFLHNIERFIKIIAKRFVQNNYTPIKIDKAKRIFPVRSYCKILLLRHDRLGDVLISTPFLKALRELMPEANIDILLSYKNMTLAPAAGRFIDNVLVLENSPRLFIKLISGIRKKHYDLIIDLLDNESTTSNLIMKFSLANNKLGFDKSNANNYNYVVPIPNRGQVHIARRLFSLLLPFGATEPPDKINIELPLNKDSVSKAARLLGKKEKSIRLGINLTGSNESKYWGDNHYIDFINEIKAVSDVECLLFAVPRIMARAERISDATGAKLAPLQSDFYIYVAMLNECDIILTPDTVAVHIAAALDKPVIALFHSPEPDKLMPWYPLCSHSKSIVAKYSITEIKVKQVLSAFIELMGAE